MRSYTSVLASLNRGYAVYIFTVNYSESDIVITGGNYGVSPSSTSPLQALKYRRDILR